MCQRCGRGTASLGRGFEVCGMASITWVMFLSSRMLFSTLEARKLMLPTFYESEKAMVPHSSSLAWKILWTEEPGRLQSMGSLRVGYNWATSLSLFTFMHWRRKWQPTLQCSCLENPRDRGAWRAAVYGVAQSRTRLKWLSSSSSMGFSRQEYWSGLPFPSPKEELIN